VNSQLAEAVVRLVQDAGNVQRRRARGKGAVTLNVASHTIDDVSHGLAGVGVKGVVVDNRALVDGAVGAKGEGSLIPMNVTRVCISRQSIMGKEDANYDGMMGNLPRQVGIDTVLQEQGLECISHVLLVS
jgi:hypothetical protein